MPQLVVQALGPKPTIAPSTPDDEKVDTSNRKKAALYMVRNILRGQQIESICALCLKRTDLVLLFGSLDLRCFWFHEGDVCGPVQSLQAGYVVA